MNKRKVVVYLHVAFETHEFTINREADISHVIFFLNLFFFTVNTLFVYNLHRLQE